MFERQITWDIIPWIKSFTKLPVVIKGILTAEDARLAVQHGADAIVVSNHGGRQLDGVLATVSNDHKTEIYLMLQRLNNMDVLSTDRCFTRSDFSCQWSS